jgi:hypothetical protein
MEFLYYRQCERQLLGERGYPDEGHASPSFGRDPTGEVVLDEEVRTLVLFIYQHLYARVIVELKAEGTLSSLNPAKLHVEFARGITPETPLSPRCYTSTHSDSTGDLFLTIAPEFNQKQISGWYTRFMRDEVVAEWQENEEGPALPVFCHISGGFVFGSAAMRYGIFQSELSLVLEAFRLGDEKLFRTRPELDLAPIWVHFHSTNRRYQKIERRGTLANNRF